MYQVQIQGAKELMKKIDFIAQALPEVINQTLYSEGERIVNELRNEFPGLNFLGQFFPQSSEFWIYSNAQVICKVTGKPVDVNVERQVGRRSQKSGSYAAIPLSETLFAKELNLSDIVSKYGPQIANAIEITIRGYIV